MALTCNIDARGRMARLVYGIILVLGGVALAWFWAMPAGSALGWVVVVFAIGGGGFAIFEARAGWCVIRAMGMRTPM